MPDTDTPTPAPSPARPLEQEEKDKIAAETAKVLAETAKTEAERRTAEAAAAIQEIALDREVEKRRREKLHDDFDHHRYHFDAAVSNTSVDACIKQLRAWDRDNPACDIEIAFSSPGGSVIDGMELFDYISSFTKRCGGTHEVTTSAYGMAASMAGILLQAGDTRVCGPQAYVLIHEVSFGASGKIGEIEDEVKFIRMVQGRVLDIFTARCKGADDATATKRLTRAKLARAWERHDFWVNADDALAYGLVDRVSYNSV